MVSSLKHSSIIATYFRATRNRSGNLNDASDSSPKKTKGNTRSSSILVESTSKGPNEEQIVEFAGCLNSVTKYGIEERAAALFCLAQRHFSGKMPQDNKPEEGRPQKKHKLPKIQRPPSMRKKNDGNDDTQQYSFFTSALMMLQPNI